MTVAEDILDELKQPNRLLTVAGGLLVGLLAGSLLSTFCLFLLETPVAGNGLGARLLHYWPIPVAFLAGACSGFGLWYVFREAYYRLGSGRRVAIYFEAHKAHADDFRLAKGHFQHATSQDPNHPAISLKVIPSALAQNTRRRKKLLARWGIHNYFHITVIEGSAQVPSPRFQVKWGPDFQSRFDEQFNADTIRLMTLLGGDRPLNVGDSYELIGHQSALVGELVLVAVALADFVDGRYEDCAAFLMSIDSRIRNRFQETRQPRFAFRAFARNCLIKPCAFSGNQPPSIDVLDRCIQNCEAALRLFGHQFPDTYIPYARVLFFRGRVAEALRATDAAIEKYRDHPRMAVRHLWLNQFVLRLFLNDFQGAAKSWSRFLATRSIDSFDWDDLVGFADHVALNGPRNAVVLQYLYRRIRDDREIPEAIMEQATEWFASGEDRTPIRLLVESACLPRISVEAKISDTPRSSRLQKKMDRRDHFKERRKKSR